MVCAAISACPAWATQHLLDSTTSPETISNKLQPGDEIVLMPGEHLGFRLKDVKGTREQPIVIRGLDARQPGPIRAQKNFYGIHLVDCEFVEVRNVIVFGAQYVGIFVDSSSTEKLHNANITIDNAMVVQTGRALRGDRDGIRVHGIENVTIRDCRIEGWTDAAIDVVASKAVTIERCTVRHREGFDSLAGIVIRAGSTDVTVSHCLLESAGNIVVAAGRPSPDADFRPRIASDAPSGTLLEATNVTVRNCVYNRGYASLSLVHAKDVRFMKNTISNPRLHIILARRETKDPRFAPSSEITFGGNLMEWIPSDLQSIANVDESLDPSTFRMETNLWASPELPGALKALGVVPGWDHAPQVIDVEPKLDSERRPTEPKAQGFGAFSP